MNTLEKLDKVDLQILRTLQSNARLTTKELAASVSLSSTPVFERLKRLENGGYIKKYIAVLDAEKLNQGFVVFCSVKLRRLNKEITFRDITGSCRARTGRSRNRCSCRPYLSDNILCIS